VLATLADVALGYAMLAAHGGKSGFVTVHLAVDYAGSAKVGDWIESDVEIQRVGARLAFANCYLVAQGNRIVRASALFASAAKAGWNCALARSVGLRPALAARAVWRTTARGAVARG
jgi:acyl-coenzyme A thioesterase PaaI-like protein